MIDKQLMNTCFEFECSNEPDNQIDVILLPAFNMPSDGGSEAIED